MTCAECELRPALRDDPYYRCLECKRREEEEPAMKPKIYVFCNTRCNGRGDWHNMLAIAEDGTCLAGHICSHHGFARHDMGFEGTWKHEHYNAHYPDGWELEWIDDPTPGLSPVLDAVFAKAQAKAAAKEVKP